MFKQISKYWLCQVIGWGAFGGINIFFYVTLSTKAIDYFYLLIFIDIILGMLVSHLMRMIILEYKYLEKNIQSHIKIETTTGNG